MRVSVPPSSLTKKLSEYLDVDAICRLLDFLGITVLFNQTTPSPAQKRPPSGGPSRRFYPLLVQANDTLRRD